MSEGKPKQNTVSPFLAMEVEELLAAVIHLLSELGRQISILVLNNLNYYGNPFEGLGFAAVSQLEMQRLPQDLGD